METERKIPETTAARVRRVSLASIPGWSRVALAAWKAGNWEEAKAAAKHVSSLLNTYGWENEAVGNVFYVAHGRAGIKQMVRVGKRGARYVRRLRKDGTASKPQA